MSNSCDNALDNVIRLSKATNDEAVFIFHELRRERTLSRTMHKINELLETVTHRKVARRAVERLGFGATL